MWVAGSSPVGVTPKLPRDVLDSRTGTKLQRSPVCTLMPPFLVTVKRKTLQVLRPSRIDIDLAWLPVSC